MKFQKTRPRPLNNPEVVLNLWAYADEGGYIVRLAGKAYVMDGSDEEKLAQLHALSATDFLSATWQSVPKNFTVTNADGEEMHGVAHSSMISDENSHGVYNSQKARQHWLWPWRSKCRHSSVRLVRVGACPLARKACRSKFEFTAPITANSSKPT